MMAAAQQLSPFDQRRLDEHLATCAPCRSFYQDMAMLAGAVATADAAPTETTRPLKALTMVPPVTVSPNRPASAGQGNRWRPVWVAAAGIACFACGLASARYVETRNATVPPQQAAAPFPHSPITASTKLLPPPRPVILPPAATAPAPVLDETSGLIADLKRQRQQLDADHSDLGALQQQREQAAQSNQELTAALEKLRLEGSAQQAVISQTKLQLDQAQDAQAQDAKLLASRDEQLRQLATTVVASASDTAEDRRLNEASRLMGQRNLHVVDVYDNNTRGQRSPSFGRVFYSEGGPMMFVAFDLPGNGSGGKTVYHAWGQTEGSSRKPLQLGTFTQDDAAAQRWVMRVSDTRLLKQVDAVFITADRGTEVHSPSGMPLLYAYLRQVPNHP